MIDSSTYDVISTTNRVLNIDNDLFEAPSKVMQTAITPRNGTKKIEFYWDRRAQPKDPTPDYIVIMHFSELQLLPNNAVREFYVNINGELFYSGGVTPDYLRSNAVFNTVPLPSYPRYNVSINSTANSTLPPFINANISTTNFGTDSQDGMSTSTHTPSIFVFLSHDYVFYVISTCEFFYTTELRFNSLHRSSTFSLHIS